MTAPNEVQQTPLVAKPRSLDADRIGHIDALVECRNIYIRGALGNAYYRETNN